MGDSENPTPVSERTLRVLLKGVRASVNEFHTLVHDGGEQAAIDSLRVEIDGELLELNHGLAGYKLLLENKQESLETLTAFKEKSNAITQKFNAAKAYVPPPPTASTGATSPSTSAATTVTSNLPIPAVPAVAQVPQPIPTVPPPVQVRPPMPTGPQPAQVPQPFPVQMHPTSYFEMYNLQMQVQQMQQRLAHVIDANNSLVGVMDDMRKVNEDNFRQLHDCLRPPPSDSLNLSGTPTEQLRFPIATSSTVKKQPPPDMNSGTVGYSDLSTLLLQFGMGKTSFKFNGDPAQYLELKSTYHNYVESRTKDPTIMFAALLDMLDGPALNKVSACKMLQPSDALKQAQDILEQAYGDPGQIEQAFIKKFNTNETVYDDADKLQCFFDDLRAYAISLSSMKKGSKPSYDFVKNAYQRLPRFLQEKFLNRLESKDILYDYTKWFDELLLFIDTRIKRKQSLLSGLLKPSGKFNHKQSQRTRFEGRNVSAGVGAKDDVKTDGGCVMCSDQSHGLAQCPRFLALSVKERQGFVREKRVCFLCFKRGHWSHRCRVVPVDRAPDCKAKGHHRLLCHCGKPVGSNLSSFVTTDSVYGAAARLKTPTVRVLDASKSAGDSFVCHALLDDGSVLNLCSRKMADKLGLKGVQVTTNLETADGVITPLQTECVSLKISGFRRNEVFVLKEVLVMDKLPDLKSNILRSNDLSSYPHLNGLEVEFPDLEDNDVHLVIGIGQQELHEFSKIKKGAYGLPWAAQCPLGWVVYGMDKHLVPSESVTSCFVQSMSFGTLAEDSPSVVDPELSSEYLDRKMTRLYDAEHVDDPYDDDVGLSVNDKRCWNTFEDSLTRVDGRWQVALPFKNDDPKLPNNFSAALKNLKNLEKRLNSDKKLCEFYVNYMNDLFKNSHAVNFSMRNLKLS